jgi:hypothetical protein
MKLIDNIKTLIKCKHHNTHYEERKHETSTGIKSRVYKICSDCSEILWYGKDRNDCYDNEMLTKEELIKKSINQ